MQLQHFLKFLVVGTIGFVINTIVLISGVKMGLSPSLSGPLGAELAILSNFILNNFWTFSDKTILSWQVLPAKFIQFNILSFGSVVIQFIFLKVGELLFGLTRFKEPFVEVPFLARMPLVKFALGLPVVGKIAKKFSAYFIFYCTGVAVGLVINFFIYSKIIWK